MFDFLQEGVRTCAARVIELGGEVHRCQVGKPASAAELDRLRRRLQCELPESLERLLMSFSKRVDFRWQIEGRAGPPALKGQLLWGEVAWDIRKIDFMHPCDYWWAEEIIAGPSPGDWLKKIVLCTAPDGDLLCIGAEGPLRDKPVYIDHAGASDEIDRVLDDDLVGFFDAWRRSGFLMINAFSTTSDGSVTLNVAREYLNLA